MSQNKILLQSIVDMLNYNPMVTVESPLNNNIHKITLIEDLDKQYITLDLGYTIFKESSRPIDDKSYRRLYDNFISTLFYEYQKNNKIDFLNSKKNENESK